MHVEIARVVIHMTTFSFIYRAMIVTFTSFNKLLSFLVTIEIVPNSIERLSKLFARRPVVAFTVYVPPVSHPSHDIDSEFFSDVQVAQLLVIIELWQLLNQLVIDTRCLLHHKQVSVANRVVAWILIDRLLPIVCWTDF